MNDRQPAPNPEDFAATDQCVMCGLCLPHCPTYLQTGNEADSPRGRISLIQALARGELPADAALTRHLDGCLVCRACEDVCPSAVPYGRLIDSARIELRRRGRHAGTANALLNAMTHRRGMRRLIYRGLRAAQGTGLWRVAGSLGLRRTPSLGRLYGLAGRLPAAPLQLGTCGDPERPAVYLFTGCAGEVFDRETLNATRRLLLALGYRVLTPPTQTCCGALHLHTGDRDTARALAQANLATFDEAIPIIVTASACAGSMREYALLLGEAGERLGARVHEAADFLASATWTDNLRLQPLERRAAVHVPCSQRRVLHAPNAAVTLLRRLPGLEVVLLPGNDTCCGAAGSYMLDHPVTADALAAPKIAAVAKLAPDLLVTTNIGCAIHLARALADAGRPVEVVHPAALLARQLPALAEPAPSAYDRLENHR